MGYNTLTINEVPVAKFRIQVTHVITQFETYEVEADSAEEAEEMLEWGPQNDEDAINVNIKDRWNIDSVEEVKATEDVGGEE